MIHYSTCYGRYAYEGGEQVSHFFFSFFVFFCTWRKSVPYAYVPERCGQYLEARIEALCMSTSLHVLKVTPILFQFLYFYSL